MVLACKRLQGSPHPTFTATKAGGFCPGFMDLIDFFDHWADVGNRLPVKGEQRSGSFIAQSLQFALPADYSAPAKTLLALYLFIVLGGERKRALQGFPG